MPEIKPQIFAQIKKLCDGEVVAITDDTPLLGEHSILDSMKLFELCLALEDLALGLGFNFDWVSAEAMSRSRSMFRTAGSLAAEFLAQMDAAK